MRLVLWNRNVWNAPIYLYSHMELNIHKYKDICVSTFSFFNNRITHSHIQPTLWNEDALHIWVSHFSTLLRHAQRWPGHQCFILLSLLVCLVINASDNTFLCLNTYSKMTAELSRDIGFLIGFCRVPLCRLKSIAYITDTHVYLMTLRRE